MSRVDWNSKAFVRAVREATDDAVGDAARALERDAQNIMGRGQATIGQPSRPGEPPHVQTGTLRRSIRATRRKFARWVVGAGVAYGTHLEFGTVRMAARPWLRPALRAAVNSGRLNRVFTDSLSKGIARRVVSRQIVRR